jgi:hypothetical protein
MMELEPDWTMYLISKASNSEGTYSWTNSPAPRAPQVRKVAIAHQLSIMKSWTIENTNHIPSSNHMLSRKNLQECSLAWVLAQLRA